jgi:hypothetical protein
VLRGLAWAATGLLVLFLLARAGEPRFFATHTWPLGVLVLIESAWMFAQVCEGQRQRREGLLAQLRRFSTKTTVTH